MIGRPSASTIRVTGRSNVAPLPGVEAFWSSERIGALFAERVLPTGRAQVIVDLDTGVATIVGPRTVSAVVVPPRRAVGFALSGSGLARIVGGDAHQLVDAVIDLGDLDRGLPHAPASGCDAALRALAVHLVQRFEVDDRIVAAEHLLRSGAPATSVPSQLGFDRRKFVPAFRGLVGLAPKHYEVLGRLQRTTAVLRSGTDTVLATIAAERGFADQAHMCRDVRRHTGHTPKEIRLLAPGPPNHVPVDVASA